MANGRAIRCIFCSVKGCSLKRIYLTATGSAPFYFKCKRMPLLSLSRFGSKINSQLNPEARRAQN